MNEENIERLLAEAFDAQARASVPDAPPPPPRYAMPPVTHSPNTHVPAHAHVDLGRAVPRRRTAWLAPVAAAAAVVAVLSLVFGLTRGSDRGHQPVADGSSTPNSSTQTPSSSSATSSTDPTPARTSEPRSVGVAPTAGTTGKPVHIRLVNASGATYGVGMPVIALISHRITDGRAFQRATVVTVNGQTADAAWYFEPSNEVKGYPLVAHLRMQDYWPAHAKIAVSLPVHGVSAGGGYMFADDLSLVFDTGARTISTVDDRTHHLTVTRDGRTLATYPVSLGTKSTPTSSGTKIVMAKGASICMSGPGYRECGIKDTQQLTYSGEYLHSAPWNIANIGAGIDSSNGCTNLLPVDAQKLYAESRVGDVVRFLHTDGPKMTVGKGFGDWNVAWSEWRTGGSVPTS